MSATTTKPERASAPAAGDLPLRRARELLEQGRLAPASAAGWQAAWSAVASYAGVGGPDGRSVDGDGDGDRDRDFFAEAARRLAQDGRGDDRAAEWAASALALYDNARYDWLDREGVGRRLDDMQRLSILAQDIAEPPQNAEDILRRAWQCMDNGALAVASEKGWAAALAATKIYAEVAGCEYRGEYHFEQAVKLLAKEGSGRREVVDWQYSALNLCEYASYCNAYPHWLDREMVAGDIEGVSKLVALIRELIADGGRRGKKDV